MIVVVRVPYQGTYSAIESDRAVQVRNLFKLTSGKALLDICLHDFGDVRHLSENWNVHN